MPAAPTREQQRTKDPAVRLLEKIVVYLRLPFKGDRSDYARGYRDALADVLRNFKFQS